MASYFFRDAPVMFYHYQMTSNRFRSGTHPGLGP